MEESKKPVVRSVKSLGFPWQTQNPFLFCVHHLDLFPEGNEEFGPNASLEGRNLGNDFVIRDGYRMYHGDRVPGFPAHPHRGFETITIVLKGFVDHSDSHGGSGRYGNGDVQWMTAGKGLQHSEMFPLLDASGSNTLELFQVWLNLPAAKKFVEPHYKMLWKEEIPIVKSQDKNGRHAEVTVVAGTYEGHKAPAPAPDSWAANPSNDVAIWRIQLEAGGEWKVPACSAGTQRTLFFFKGKSISLNETDYDEPCALELDGDQDAWVVNGEEETHMLLLQGRPILEPVEQYGPFVMNTRSEIQQAMQDYQQTRFGGWPWSRHDPVHGPDQARFAKYPDGSMEAPE